MWFNIGGNVNVEGLYLSTKVVSGSITSSEPLAIDATLFFKCGRELIAKQCVLYYEELVESVAEQGTRRDLQKRGESKR